MLTRILYSKTDMASVLQFPSALPAGAHFLIG